MNESLIIEVRGIGFPNKGAELMLLAVCDKIQARYPNAKICLQPTYPYYFRMNYPVYQIARVVRFGFDFGRMMYLIPKKLRSMFGIVMPSEVNVILDASGFAYGDQWGVNKSTEWLSREIGRFKRIRNHKVVLLPQAFGPFTQPNLREHMQEIVSHADAVFARDVSSFKHLKELSSSQNIHLAPDFTNRYNTRSGDFEDLKKYPVCFIPNSKMLEMKSIENENSYVQFMATLIKSAHNIECAPYILVHEGDKDLALAKQIKSLLGFELPIVQPSTAEKVKQAIGVSKLVVSSRFHGLVSALSQRIPVIATGWSHKYQALLQDYGVEDCIFDETKELQGAETRMLALLSSDNEYEKVRKTISDNAEQEKKKTDLMWQQVYSVLDDNNE